MPSKSSAQPSITGKTKKQYRRRILRVFTVMERKPGEKPGGGVGVIPKNKWVGRNARSTGQEKSTSQGKNDKKRGSKKPNWKSSHRTTESGGRKGAAAMLITANSPRGVTDVRTAVKKTHPRADMGVCRKQTRNTEKNPRTLGTEGGESKTGGVQKERSLSDLRAPIQRIKGEKVKTRLPREQGKKR